MSAPNPDQLVLGKVMEIARIDIAMGQCVLDIMGQNIIHSLSATQLTRKVRSSCVEACGGKCLQCQHLHMTLASFVSKKHQ